MLSQFFWIRMCVKWRKYLIENVVFVFAVAFAKYEEQKMTLEKYEKQ